MINGDPREFLAVVDSGKDIEYLFDGERYWYLGYTKNDRQYIEIYRPQYIDLEGVFFMRCIELGTSLSEVFIKEPLFNGEMFWDAEKDITWIC